MARSQGQPWFSLCVTWIWLTDTGKSYYNLGLGWTNCYKTGSGSWPQCWEVESRHACVCLNVGLIEFRVVIASWCWIWIRINKNKNPYLEDQDHISTACRVYLRKPLGRLLRKLAAIGAESRRLGISKDLTTNGSRLDDSIKYWAEMVYY